MPRAAIFALLALIAFPATPLTARAADAPASPTTPTARPDGWWQARHARLEAALRRGPAELLFLGDSITEGWEREGRAVWQQYYGKRRAVNLGIGGDQTGHVLWRLARASLERQRPRVAVLLVGVNNAFRPEHSAAAIADGIGAVVRLLRRRLPRTRVLLLGVFPAAAGPSPLRAKIAEINRRLAALARERMVRYLDLGPRFVGLRGFISRNVMHDYLHLTEEGYRSWAAGMEPTLRELLAAR